MHKPVKYFEKVVTVGANAAWQVFDRVNQINQNPSFTPKWSDKPLLKSYQKVEAATRLAARDRFAVPQVHSGDPARRLSMAKSITRSC